MLGAHEVTFPAGSEEGRVRGIVHTAEPARAGVLLTHGRTGDMNAPLIRRLSIALAEAGLWTLRFNFRYTDEKAVASRDLAREENDLLAAVRFARKQVPAMRILVGGVSMGARVCARASGSQDVVGVIALGYPLHPPGRPEVQNPPEWPKLVKPTLFVQGDHDPFCDLTRLRADLPKLSRPHELVIIENAGHSFESRGVKRDTFPEVRDAVLAWITKNDGA